jgi:hypothetical protein
MHSGLYVFPCPSRAKLAYKCILHFIFFVVSRRTFHAISTGALVFGVSLILYTRIKLFTETALAVTLHFQHLSLNLQENHVHLLKEPKMI